MYMENERWSHRATTDLLEEIGRLNRSNFGSESERVQIRDALSAALPRLETPWETALRLCFTQPALAATLKVCHDIGLFQKWENMNGDRGTSGEGLSKLVGVDSVLLVRFLRHLQTTQIIQQASPGIYTLTPFAKALATDQIGSTIPFLYNTNLPGFVNLPNYLRETQYANPTDASHTNWHHMRGLSRFDELNQRPADMAIFQTVMTTSAAAKTPWTEIFPTEELIRAQKPNTSLLVDVGGGAGHDVERLRKCLTQTAPGVLVLQDLESITEHIAVHDSITMMAHDFFEEQPIKGATAYYLHTVLHDWPDARAVTILSNIALAAEPDYSRVLIHETVITDTPSTLNTTSDLQMMMVLSSFERTEAQWRNIVAAAGLDIVKIWQAPESAESIIEAVRRR